MMCDKVFHKLFVWELLLLEQKSLCGSLRLQLCLSLLGGVFQPFVFLGSNLVLLVQLVLSTITFVPSTFLLFPHGIIS